MAKTPEKKVKDMVVAVLKRYGAYYFYASTGGYGASGVPDIIACYETMFIGIEVKAGKNKPTALQKLNLTQIHSAGGLALCVSDTPDYEADIIRVEDLVSVLEFIKQEKDT